MNEMMIRITNLMKEQKITGKELCKRLGIVESNLVQWKKGRDGYRLHLPEIAQILGCSVEYLITGKESQAEEFYRAYKQAPEKTQRGIRLILNIEDETV